MKLLPAHLIKLRFLLKNSLKLKTVDSNYIRDISNILAASKDLDACPITIFMIENLYNAYRTQLKQEEL